MKIFTSLFFSLFLLIGCSKKMSFQNWQGLSQGDSHFLIQDSLIICNGPDIGEMQYKINKITKDSLFCNAFDPETGRIAYPRSFSYDSSQNTVTSNINSSKITYNHISNFDHMHKHVINRMIYTIYDYDQALYTQYVLKSNGELTGLAKDSTELYKTINIQGIENVFDKIAILDLDNIVYMDKMFFQASHADCHCLDITYNNNQSLKYCRQLHNLYFRDILYDIRQMFK